MREITFRAWDIENKWFIYDYDQKISNKYPSVKLGDDIHNTVRRIGLYFKTLQQYTGLKDKNGLEIYEGDILLEENKGAIRAINKPRQNSIVVFKDDGWKRDTYNGSLNVFPPINVIGMEIIGNIYENPELLK